ncbi:hypothetical protein G6F37_012826 [Rhizopus arrhizus]|nr:hypothetical protein G6F37_012826 [Rhizopus arrhizus]
MLTKKLKNYNQSKDIELYVFLGGKTIKGKTADDILEIIKCSFVKPISAIKNQKVAGFCLLKFKDKQDAATFFYYYNKQNCTLCRSLYPLFVKPAKFKDQPVAQYSCDNIQTTLNRTSTWCRCTNITASANNHDANNNTETTVHTPSITTSPRSSHIAITPTATHHDTNASTTAIVTNIISTANKQYSVLELYEQQLQKIKEEVKEDELRLAKKKREIEHDERMIQMKRKKIDLLLQLTLLEQS